jgi:energy-coupling factor transport system ATP-binding protein
MKAIELIDVSFAYPGGFVAVEGLNMAFEKGESVAIIGQNGAGKTTTVKMMNNLYQPTTGAVLVNGESTRCFTTAQVARKVGYVFQNPDDQIFQSEVGKEVAYSSKVNKVPPDEAKKWFDIAIELTGLGAALDENPYNLPLSVRKFVTIASVIALNPEVVILDEPTAGQDLMGLRLLANAIRTLKGFGKTVITITHDMDFVVENFERVIVMANKRKVADGNVKDIFWNAETMERSALKQPAICALAGKLNLDGDIITDDELIQAIKERCEHHDKTTILGGHIGV